jgi:hypothetical protein
VIGPEPPVAIQPVFTTTKPGQNVWLYRGTLALFGGFPGVWVVDSVELLDAAGNVVESQTNPH